MKKKSILFIADLHNWAYHHLVKTWSNYLTDYDCYIAFSKDYELSFSEFSAWETFYSNTLHKFIPKPFYKKIHSSRSFSYPVHKKNLVYHVDGMVLIDKNEFDIQIDLAYYFQYVSKFPFNSKFKLVGIFTDSFPHEGPSFDGYKQQDTHDLDRKAFYENYLAHYDGILVGNENLYQDYQLFTNSLIYSTGIYLQEEFKGNLNVGKSEGLIIGWTGNPKRAMKGFYEVILPAIEELQEKGLNIKLKTKFSGPYEELLDFYTDVDLIVIASEADTGPSLFAEASLSNVPSISTKIGFPQAVIQDEINGRFCLRDKTQIKNIIEELYYDRSKLIQYSKRIKKDYLMKYDNKLMAQNLMEFLKKFN